MSQPAISVRNLGKKYRLGATLKHDTLRDHLTHGLKTLLKPFGRKTGIGRRKSDAEKLAAASRPPPSPGLRSSLPGGEGQGEGEPSESGQPSPAFHPPTSNDLWALKDVSFDVQPGEIVGVIGRNGAGKSTLLKILSQITYPTEGQVHIRGRVASLLEVGTGFHPELTGRENVFLNGAILGMSQADVRRRFDEIVDFSGVERFLDTPIKRYSSGMHVRLAFAVAAHLEPEILIVDEVLAVGDHEFQSKCLGKMEEVAQGGRTILFVSHNMGAIQRLCPKALLLADGHIREHGPTDEVVSAYLANRSRSDRPLANENPEPISFISAQMENSVRIPDDAYEHDDPITVDLRLRVAEPNPHLELAMRLIDKQKTPVFTIHERLQKFSRKSENIELKVQLPGEFLVPGIYSWTICINHPGFQFYDLHEDVLPFTILETGSAFSRYAAEDYGRVHAQYKIQDQNLTS